MFDFAKLRAAAGLFARDDRKATVASPAPTPDVPAEVIDQIRALCFGPSKLPTSDGVNTWTESAFAGRHVTQADPDNRMEDGWALSFADGRLGFTRDHASVIRPDDTRITESSAWGWQGGLDGVDATARRSITRDDGVNAATRAGDLRIGTGGVHATGELSQRTTANPDTWMERAHRFALANDRLGYDHRTASSLVDDDGARIGEQRGLGGALDARGGWDLHGSHVATRDDGINRDSRSASAALGSAGVSAQLASTHRTGDDDNHIFRDRSLGYAGGNVTLASNSGGVRTDDDGVRHEDRTATSVSVGKDGLAAGVTRTSGGVTTGLSGTVAPDQVGAKASVGAGPATLSVSGGFQVSARVVEPAVPGAPWFVDWERTAKAGGGLAAKGRGVGASVSASHATTERGRRPFASEADARTFAAEAALVIGDALPPATTAAGAMSLVVGETRGEGEVDQAGGGLSGSAHGVEISGGVTGQSSSGYQVTRTSEDLFEVTVQTGSGAGGHLGGGTWLASVGGSRDDQQSLEVTVQFDLSEPGDRAAYDEMQRTRQVPAGARVVRTRRARQATSATDLSIAGGLLDAGHRDLVGEEVIEGDGTRTEIYSGEHQARAGGKLLALLGEREETAHGMTVTETDDAERTYAIQATVDSTDGEAANDLLAYATNTFNNAGAWHQTPRASGKWGVSAELSEGEMRAFFRMARGGRFDATSLNRDWDEGEDFQAELRAAGDDLDEQHRVLTRFVARHGAKGLRVVQDNIAHAGGQMGADLRRDFDITLAGDANFGGAPERKRVERVLADLGLRLGDGDARAVAADALGEESALRARRAAVADPARYVDLPHQLREAELARLDAQLGALGSVRAQAERKVTDDAGADQGPEPADPAQAAVRRKLREVSRHDQGIDAARSIYAAAREQFELAQPIVLGVPTRDAFADPLLYQRELARHQHSHARDGAYLRRGAAAWHEAEKLRLAAEAFAPLVQASRTMLVAALDEPERAAMLADLVVAQQAVLAGMLDRAAEQMNTASGLYETVIDADPRKQQLLEDRLRQAAETEA